MNRVCVVTSESRAYYALVSRLRRAGLPFESLLPESDFADCDLILTTLDESGKFGDRSMALEELDDNPGVFRGQIVSRLTGGNDVLLVGIDPGKRTGLAVFYGKTRLAFSTFDSLGPLCARVATFLRSVPAGRRIVRVGNGSRTAAQRVVQLLSAEELGATIEVVDESGTSTRGARFRGVQGDQRAAAQIAFRKGEVIARALPRNRW